MSLCALTIFFCKWAQKEEGNTLETIPKEGCWYSVSFSPQKELRTRTPNYTAPMGHIITPCSSSLMHWLLLLAISKPWVWKTDFFGQELCWMALAPLKVGSTCGTGTYVLEREDKTLGKKKSSVALISLQGKKAERPCSTPPPGAPVRA